MADTPQQGDALEAAARELAENLTLYGATEQDVADALAIMRRHGLRAPAPDPDRAALVERPDLPARLREICRHYEMTGVEFDEMQEAARALAAPAEREGWRPIESAPKDGSEVLAWTRHGIGLARWDHVLNDGWLMEDGELITVSRDDAPTHWMPLPPAPQRQEGQDGA